MTPKEKKEYIESVQATWTKDDLKRIRKLYPKVCLYCGAKTEERTHITSLSGRYKGNKTKTYNCTNPKCGTEWGGYI
jgi:hypothetical protein